MTLAVTTLNGLHSRTDVSSLEEYTDIEGKEVYHLTFFHPKMEDVIIDKKEVLLIQVLK